VGAQSHGSVRSQSAPLLRSDRQAAEVVFFNFGSFVLREEVRGKTLFGLGNIVKKVLSI
jgi:hypothetical protein